VARGRRTSTPSGAKVLTGPPPAGDFDPVVATVVNGTELLRIYAPEPYDTAPLTFREFGPLNRFDHQRSNNGPQVDSGRGILYAGFDLVCCVGEYFGDTGAVTRVGNRLTKLLVEEPVEVLDLREEAATGAGTIPAIGGVGERFTTQAWARWWYEHPDLENAAGLLYTSAQTGKDALAFWERAEGRFSTTADWELTADEIRDDLELAAHRVRLPIF
jgi:hypothetical protein